MEFATVRNASVPLLRLDWLARIFAKFFAKSNIQRKRTPFRIYRPWPTSFERHPVSRVRDFVTALNEGCVRMRNISNALSKRVNCVVDADLASILKIVGFDFSAPTGNSLKMVGLGGLEPPTSPLSG